MEWGGGLMEDQFPSNIIFFNLSRSPYITYPSKAKTPLTLPLTEISAENLHKIGRISTAKFIK